MPDLDTTLHLDMLNEFHTKKIPLRAAAERGYATRQILEEAVAAGKLSVTRKENGVRLLKISELRKLYGDPGDQAPIYGMHWGDPETVAPLRFIKNHYVTPLIKTDAVGVEIGPGGG